MWTEPTFKWDLFALCGDPANPAHGSTINGDKYGSSGSSINPENRAGAYNGFGEVANPKRYSSWPDKAAGGRPRSSLVVIAKDDGGKIGT